MKLLDKIVRYLTRDRQTLARVPDSKDPRHVELYRGFKGPVAYIYPILWNSWHTGDVFPYNPVNIYHSHMRYVSDLGIPGDIWVVRKDSDRAIVLPEQYILECRYNTDTEAYEVNTLELGNSLDIGGVDRSTVLDSVTEVGPYKIPDRRKRNYTKLHGGK